MYVGYMEAKVTILEWPFGYYSEPIRLLLPETRVHTMLGNVLAWVINL